MKPVEARRLMVALHAALDGNDRERVARRIIEHVFDKAMAGHTGCLLFLLRAVDGPIRRTTEEEAIFESDCMIVVGDDGPDGITAIAA